MGNLLYFTVFAGLDFLMMRFGCGAHVMGHAMTITMDRMPPGPGSTSRHVRAAPDRYVGSKAAPELKPTEHSHG